MWHPPRVPNPEPSEIPRPLFSRRPDIAPAPVEPPAERAESFHPQYVRLHTLREHGHGPRNLAWGVVTLILALGLIGVSMFLVGPKVLLSLAICLLTFTALFVLARMHIFRQRNGGFLALGIVCLFGAAMPLIELAYGALDAFVKSRPIAVIAPVVPQAGSPLSAANETAPLSMTEAFALTPPDAKAGPRVRVVKDARVSVEGKTYLAKSGDIFAFAGRNGREVNIAARDLLITLPAEAVEITDEKPASSTKTLAGSEPAAKPAHAAEEPVANETPAEMTARAQREVIRRYPALGVRGSMENQAFINLFGELRDNGGDDFFKNPEWPIELAELLAKREHWQRGAPPATVGPASGPEEETPAAPALR
ncbi:MAG: hypothetical protein WCF18_20370 [Chthoniobacteraceae bacterium]